MMKTIKILAASQDGPVPNARKVLWLIDGAWEHKGWLMPGVGDE